MSTTKANFEPLRNVLSFNSPPKPTKPRSQGMTSVIDFGPDGFGWTSPNSLSDYLDVVADFIDYAKIYAMNALLLPENIVKRVAGIYKDAGIKPYAGGILFEYAFIKNEVPDFIRHIKKLGIPYVEVSENYVELSAFKRSEAISQLQSAGINVIYEFGRKNPTETFSAEMLELVVLNNITAGVEHTIVEQSEIDFVSAHDPSVLIDMLNSSWFSNVFIEADPYTFPKGHVGLLEKFGPSVNLANVTADQVLRLHGFRHGIGRAVNYSILS